MLFWKTALSTVQSANVSELCNQDVSIVPIFRKYRVSVTLDVGGNLIKMLFSGAAFLFVDDAAFPGSFWSRADLFVMAASWTFYISMSKIYRIMSGENNGIFKEFLIVFMDG